jgi:hypothetical protein
MVAAYVVGSCMVEAASSDAEPVGGGAAMAFYESVEPSRFPTVVAAAAQAADGHLDDDGPGDVGIGHAPRHRCCGPGARPARTANELVSAAALTTAS